MSNNSINQNQNIQEKLKKARSLSQSGGAIIECIAKAHGSLDFEALLHECLYDTPGRSGEPGATSRARALERELDMNKINQEDFEKLDIWQKDAIYSAMETPAITTVRRNKIEQDETLAIKQYTKAALENGRSLEDIANTIARMKAKAITKAQSEALAQTEAIALSNDTIAENITENNTKTQPVLLTHDILFGDSKKEDVPNIATHEQSGLKPKYQPGSNDTHALDRMAVEGMFDEMLKRRSDKSNKQEKTAKSKPQSSNLLLQERTEETLNLSPFISPAIPKEDKKPQDEEVKTDDLSTLIKTKFAKDIDEDKPIDKGFAKRLTALQIDASIEKSPHHQTLFNANTKLFEQLYPSPRRKRLNRFKGKSQTIGEFMKAQGLVVD